MENNNYNNFSHKNIISVNELAHSGGLTIKETSKANLYIVVISHHSTSVVLGTLGWVKAQVISTFERLKNVLSVITVQLQWFQKMMVNHGCWWCLYLNESFKVNELLCLAYCFCSKMQ